MKQFRTNALTFIGSTLLAGVASFALPACDGDGPIGNLAEQCGFSCPDKGLLEGNASVSGLVSADAFFGATIDVKAAALEVEGSMLAELRGIAGLLKIEGAANMNIDQLGGAIKGEMDSRISAVLDGGMKVVFAPPKCEADIDVAVNAAASCDVDVEPGSVKVDCHGSCEIDADVNVQAKCKAEGTLKCEVTAPEVACMGSCTGSCQLEVAAQCTGSCNGTCEGECSAYVGGSPQKDGNGAVTNCMGSCSGMCKGTCELNAGGSCMGKCEGSCEYTPPSGMCEANASVRCEAKGEAKLDVECKGKCEGEVKPPKVKAECQASVEAKASANVQCTPPQLEVRLKFKAGVDAKARAEFRALMDAMRGRLSAMVAVDAKMASVKGAIKVLGDKAGSLHSGVKADIEAKGGLNAKAVVELGCVLKAAKDVPTVLGEATTSLNKSASAYAKVNESIKLRRR